MAARESMKRLAADCGDKKAGAWRSGSEMILMVTALQGASNMWRARLRVLVTAR